MTMNPHCRNKRHSTCNGKAWDKAADGPTMCRCACHANEAAKRIRENVMAEVRKLPHRDPVPTVRQGWDPGAARVAQVDQILIGAHHAQYGFMVSGALFLIAAFLIVVIVVGS